MLKALEGSVRAHDLKKSVSDKIRKDEVELETSPIDTMLDR